MNEDGGQMQGDTLIRHAVTWRADPIHTPPTFE
jgi:hypothetical protein